MSSQIQITGETKVKSLTGVLVGTSGVVSSLNIDGSLGIPQLDVNGKILVSQLPNSVMEYKGVWNAAANSPTLTNGGAFSQGDVYLCDTAGTVNFGAGPITFVVSDQVIYSGSIWQKASGTNGTVTSVGLSTNAGAITIGSSPITTSGTITANFNGTNLQYVNGAGNLTTFPTLITSIGLTMPSAFSVANSPLTTNGTIAVTGAGVASQYIRGDGTLANFPTSGGGGSSVAYYFNSSVSQGTLGGVAYTELSKVPIIGAGTDITIATNGYIANYITDAGDPSLLEIPAGNWNFEMFFSASSGGGSPSFYVELYKYDGTTFTLISSSSATPEGITNGTAIDLYTTALAVPLTTLTLTDRLAIRVYVNNSSRTITLHTENSHLCEVITTFSTGIAALNGLTAQVQYFQVGTSGTDFNISSTTATHTFNIPDASATARGLITTGTQTIAGAKTFSGGITFSSTLTTTSNVTFANSGFTLVLQPPTLSVNRTVTLPDGTGTLALTSDISYPVTSVFGRTGAVVATSGDYTTAQVTEVTNLYFTDSRARLALSFVAGSGAYNSTTGVITIPTNNNQITNGAGYTTNVGTVTSVAATGGTGISITGSPITTSGTITITNTAPDQTVALTASTGISVTGTYPNFTITNTSPSSGGTVTSVAALTIGTTGTDLSSSVATGTTTPVITLNVPTASAVNRGALSSADWTTFNNKQSALTNPVLASGTWTSGYLPKINGTYTIGNSQIFDNGTLIGIGNAVPTFTLDLQGEFRARPITSYPAGQTGKGISIRYDTVGANDFGYLVSYDWSTAAYQEFRIDSLRTIFNTGNVLINTTTDSGYKLDVNGTGRFTNTLTITGTSSSKINLYSNFSGGNVGMSFFNTSNVENIYFNSANGSINCIGPINGGAATFSGAVGINGVGPTYPLYVRVGTNQRFRVVDGGSGYTQLASLNDAESSYTPIMLGNSWLSIASTGAATFTSAVTNGVSIVNTTSGSALISFSNTANGHSFGFSSTGTGGQRFSFFNGAPTEIAYITSAGAATFSSSVTTNGGFISIQGAQQNSLWLNQNAGGTSTGFLLGRSYTSANTQDFFIYDVAAASRRLEINSSGAAIFISSVTATGFFESSDSRLKTLIHDNYQTKGIASITPKLYTKNGKVELGYYAQDFIGILDSAVSKGSDDMLSLSYREVLVAKVYALEQEIKELKAKMN